MIRKYLEEAAERAAIYLSDGYPVRLLVVVNGIEVKIRRGAYVHDTTVAWEDLEKSHTNPITDRMYVGRRLLEQVR